MMMLGFCLGFFGVISRVTKILFPKPPQLYPAASKGLYQEKSRTQLNKNKNIN